MHIVLTLLPESSLIRKKLIQKVENTLTEFFGERVIDNLRTDVGDVGKPITILGRGQYELLLGPNLKEWWVVDCDQYAIWCI